MSHLPKRMWVLESLSLSPGVCGTPCSRTSSTHSPLPPIQTAENLRLEMGRWSISQYNLKRTRRCFFFFFCFYVWKTCSADVSYFCYMLSICSFTFRPRHATVSAFLPPLRARLRQTEAGKPDWYTKQEAVCFHNKYSHCFPRPYEWQMADQVEAWQNPLYVFLPQKRRQALWSWEVADSRQNGRKTQKTAFKCLVQVDVIDVC